MAILNIGLNIIGQSKPMHVNRVLASVRKITSNNQILSHKKVISEYKGMIEPTLVVRVQKIKKRHVRQLCKALNQECIPVQRKTKGSLIYPRGSDQKKLKFNNEYFKQ